MQYPGEHAHNDYLVTEIGQATAIADLAALMVVQVGKRWETKTKWKTLFKAAYPIIPTCTITVVSPGTIVLTRDGVDFNILPADTPFKLPECEDLSSIFLSGAGSIFVLISFNKNQHCKPSQL